MSRQIRNGTLFLATAAVMVSSSFTSKAVVTTGDAVLQWNQVALDATAAAGQGALPQIRSMTIVQVAVHDAVNGITGKHSTYLPVGNAPAGASPEAAAIAAAHRALVGIFTSQAQIAHFNGIRAASLSARSLSESDPGIAYGENAAAAVLAARANDGAAQAQFPYVAPDSGAPGVWVTIGTARPNLPGWKNVTPWVVKSSSQFLPDAPPALDSGRYARDYREIQQIGAADSPTRTADQTDIARFWLASPSAIWNPVARQIIEAHNLDISDTARTLALMYLAASDAGLTCWDAKYTFNFWRPQAAIQQGHLDGNDDTVGDPNWTPLFQTPPHPEYLSGHSTNSSAMATILTMLFGDSPGVTIVASTAATPDITRQWATFSEGVDEVIEARIYSGIHFRTSDEVGARVGRQVARFVFHRSLR